MVTLRCHHRTPERAASIHLSKQDRNDEQDTQLFLAVMESVTEQPDAAEIDFRCSRLGESDFSENSRQVEYRSAGIDGVVEAESGNRVSHFHDRALPEWALPESLPDVRQL